VPSPATAQPKSQGIYLPPMADMFELLLLSYHMASNDKKAERRAA
jgi:hypothetical protein